MLIAFATLVQAKEVGGSEVVEPSSVAIAFEISEVGEASVLRRLQTSPSDWTYITDAVASGDQAWLNIGLLLLRSSEQQQREDLRIAFEEALAARPITLIESIVSPDVETLHLVCGPSAHREHDLAENSIASRTNAIATVLIMQSAELNTSLRHRMTQCADWLHEASVSHYAVKRGVDLRFDLVASLAVRL